MEYTLTVSQIVMISNVIVEYKHLTANARNGDTGFFHSAKVAKENISAVGAGNFVLTAKHHAARKPLYLFSYNYHAGLLEILKATPEI